MQGLNSKATTTELTRAAPQMKNPLRMIPIFNTSRVKQQLEKRLPARTVEKEIACSVPPNEPTSDPHSSSSIAGQTFKGVAIPIKIEDSDGNIPPASICLLYTSRCV